MIVGQRASVQPPVLVCLYEIVHLSVSPLELSHSHGVQVVQNETQTVLGQLQDVGVLVSWGFLMWWWMLVRDDDNNIIITTSLLTSGFDGGISRSIAVLHSSCCFTLILFIILSLIWSSPSL